jgi:hypothetical protein
MLKQASKHRLAIGIVALLLVACGGGKKAGGDAIDLQNQELAMVRDQVCACKDEACQREAMAQLEGISKRAADSGVKATKEQHALGAKTFSEIGECVKKGTKSTPPTTGAGGEIVADMVALRDAVCACKNLACASSLQPKFDQWRDKYMPTFNSLPADVRRQALEATTAQKKCYDQLAASGSGTTESVGGSKPKTPLFAGRYKSDWGAVTFEQKAADPTSVAGTYPKGTVTCKATDSELDCAWAEPGASGRAHFKRAENGDLAGTWGHGNGSTDGGAWTCALEKAGELR